MTEIPKGLSRTFEAAVVGVSFAPDYPNNLYRIRAAQGWAGVREQNESIPALLIREPENPHDTNAIAVHIPSIGEVGHLPRGLAAKMAPLMDSGVIYQAEMEGIYISDFDPERPGLRLTITMVTPNGEA